MRDKRGLIAIALACGLAFGAALLMQEPPQAVSRAPVAGQLANSQSLGAVAPGAAAPTQQVSLPKDGNRWDLVFHINRTGRQTQKDVEIQRWFDTDPDLKDIKAKSTVFYFYPDSPESRRNQYGVKAWPTVVLQTPDGSRYFRISSNNPKWPKSGHELAVDVGYRMAQLNTLTMPVAYNNLAYGAPPQGIFNRPIIKRDHGCPNPPCPPDTVPPPVPQAQPPVDTLPPPEVKKDNTAALVLIAFMASVVVLGVAAFNKRVSGVST